MSAAGEGKRLLNRLSLGSYADQLERDRVYASEPRLNELSVEIGQRYHRALPREDLAEEFYALFAETAARLRVLG